MVGRLVEQQVIGLPHQEGPERGAHAVAAGKLLQAARVVLRAEPETAQDRLGLRLEVEPAGRLEAVLHLAGPPHQRVEPLAGRRRHVVVHLLQLAFERRHLGERREQGVEDRSLDEPRPFLRQVAEGLAARQVDGALVGLLEPRDDAQDRRLAGPVRPHQSDARPGRDPPVDALQDLVHAERAADTAETEHRTSLHSRGGAVQRRRRDSWQNHRPMRRPNRAPARPLDLAAAEIARLERLVTGLLARWNASRSKARILPAPGRVPALAPILRAPLPWHPEPYARLRGDLEALLDLARRNDSPRFW